MERSILWISLHEHIQRKVILEQCRVKDVSVEYWKQKFCLARHTQTIDEPVQLSNDIQQTGNNLLENLHNYGKIKLSNDSGQH